MKGQVYGTMFLLACIAVALWPRSVEAESASEQRASLEADPRYAIAYDKYTLDNGLEVILHLDTRLPMVAVNVWYHVGAAHEPRGKSGFAHLFEHLMFEGSKHVGDRFDPLLESAGGTNMNGTTSWDRTNYFETVPAEYLELALWLEADRMGFLMEALDQAALDIQRDVVKNERRESYENSPYGPSWLRVYEELFSDGHPYHGGVIGSMRDLSAASFADVRDFFARYYAPGNATLCLAGHFDLKEARALIEKHFGTLEARGERALVPMDIPEPKPTAAGEWRVTVTEPVELAQVIWAWTAPPAYSQSEAPLEVALSVLGAGKSSRLYQALVTTGLANWVNTSLDGNQLASMVTIDAGVASGHTIGEVEAVIGKVLAELAQTGPTPAELTRARLTMAVELASEMQLLNSSGGEGGRAGILQRLNHYLGDPGALPRIVARRSAVSAGDVKGAVARFMPTARRLTVLTVPAGGSKESEP